MRFPTSIFALGLLIVGLPSPAQAQADEIDPFAVSEGSSDTKVEFLSEVRSVKPGEPFTVALKLIHPPTWHSYFVNPGGVGMILSANWKLSPDTVVERVGWAVPHIGQTGGENTYGYEPLVYHLFEVTPPADLATGSQFTITTVPRWQICDPNSCVPEPRFGRPPIVLDLKLPVTTESAIDPANVDAFVAARAMLPDKLPADLKVEASKTSSEITILLSPAEAVKGDEIHFFDYDGQMDARMDPVIERGEDGVRWTIKRNKESETETPNKLSGILKIGHEAYEVETDYGKAAAEAVTFGKLMTIFGGMFIGGMILNLMPCVFPVIGLKIMGFVQQAGEDRRTIFVHGLIYALGVILSFWVLSGLLLALREGAIGAAGQDVSWGYQLQNPWVVWVLMLVMFILAMNMYGVFEIGASATSVGSNLTHKQGMGGSFFSGILATVVATPCSAPFLGVAIGLAFNLTPILFLLSFTVMALGLAFPYVFLSAFPKFVEKLPRPGAWMESFKQAMAFLLFGTAGFLLWVYVSFKQVELSGMIKVVIGLTFLGIGVWVYGRWCTIARPKRTRTIGLAVAILFSALGLAATKPPAKGLEWKPWSPEAVQAALDEGRPVYVDFTATWCATCQVNKARAYPKKVQETFKGHNVLVLKADYTDYDPKIAERISELGRAAVPVNVLYIPGQEDPQLTKELFGAKYMQDFLTEHLGTAPEKQEDEAGTKK